MSINRITSGDVELTEIDYSTETGPFWHVYVDDTPVLPELPLPLEQAIAAFRREVDEAEDGDVVELKQCSGEDLRRAGIRDKQDGVANA